MSAAPNGSAALLRQDGSVEAGGPAAASSSSCSPCWRCFLRANPDGLSGSHLQQPQVLQAIRLSLVTSLCTVVLTVLFGTPVAYYLSHRHYRFYRLLDTLIDLPTVLPPAVAGVALLMAFGRRGLLGEWFNAAGGQHPFHHRWR